MTIITTAIEGLSTINSKLSLRTKAEVGIAALVLIAFWYVKTPTPAPINTWVPAKPAAEVAHVGTEAVACKTIIVYKDAAKQKLDLPPAIANDPNQHVISATDVKPDEHTDTVVTTVDLLTGQSTTIIRRDPYPLFAFLQKGEARFDVGLKNAGSKVGRFTLREDLLQIKGVNVGVNLNADTDRAYFIGGGLGYKW